MTESMIEKKTDPTILHNTFVVERSYPVPPERVFAAFSDPKQKREWFTGGTGSEVKEYSLDFQVGGNEIARFSPRSGPHSDTVFTARSNYQFIDPGKRIVMANTMAKDEQCISAALVSFEFLPTGSGTDLICTHQAAFFEGADGPDIRKMGWTSLLANLAKVLGEA
jgi:uncharacterized protein YndB with AHSA1/START domain